jgi:hypothetical protein
MAEDKSDQGAKDKIKKGMAESGKGQMKSGGEAGKGGPVHGADPSKLAQGMSEAGSGGKSGATSR